MCHEVSASHVVAAAAADNIRENNIDTINKDNSSPVVALNVNINIITQQGFLPRVPTA